MMESNTTQKQEPFDSPRIAAERLLSATLGNQIHIHEVECLTEMGRRNLLLRCCIDPVDGLPSSFIIKKVETQESYDPDDAKSWDTKRFFNDWIGSQFLSAIPG